METPPLAVESFSYSWLINVKPSLDGLGSPLRTSLDISDEATSKGKDYNVVKSQILMDEAQNFNFDVPTSQSSVALIHADEVFSNGFIVGVGHRTLPFLCACFFTSLNTWYSSSGNSL
ncbi:hypothetical protein PVL29_020288 [Vitis rotundifolia]|uniref:Uncharacterized protein n=1 Tax=Vitis rotundifolia TaxID=103349 RepID=A0AA38Z3L2_VITRO|nr:hypothetical protein PVL29_020288 [Vitis rotundifolia]